MKLKPEIEQTQHLDMAAEMVRRNEALVLHAYTDTVGILTIGYGRNIHPGKGPGITRAEAEAMLANDIAAADRALAIKYVFYLGLNQVRKAVMMDLYHNLGSAGLDGFKKFLAAMRSADYVTAAAELRDSRYYTQVTKRAERNAQMIEKGTQVN